MFKVYSYVKCLYIMIKFTLHCNVYNLIGYLIESTTTKIIEQVKKVFAHLGPPHEVY